MNDPRFSYFSVYENVPLRSNIPSRPRDLGVVAANYPAELRSKLQQVTMTMKLETAIGDLTSYTGYAWNKLQNRFDFDGSYILGGASTYSSTDNNQKTFQQALDYSITAVDRLDLVIGANYFQDKLTPFDAPFGTSAGLERPRQHLCHGAAAAVPGHDPRFAPSRHSGPRMHGRSMPTRPTKWSITCSSTLAVATAAKRRICSVHTECILPPAVHGHR